MNKCKYFKCEKEIEEGQKYCKFHENKVDNMKKTALQAIPTLSAIVIAVVSKKKPPKNS